MLFLGVCWVLLVFALARPQWLEDPIIRELPMRDLLVAVASLTILLSIVLHGLSANPLAKAYGQRIGDGKPGPITQELLIAYRAYVAQAIKQAIAGH